MRHLFLLGSQYLGLMVHVQDGSGGILKHKYCFLLDVLLNDGVALGLSL